MTPTEAVAFVNTHGLVLEAGAGAVPSIAETVAGASIRGSWWAHPQGRQIFAVTRAIRDSPDVLVCRLVAGKITFVHRRLWPALVCLAKRYPPPNLARLQEVHTASGKHVIKKISYPQWVPDDVAAQARTLDEERALAELEPWSATSAPIPKPAPRKPKR